MALDNVIGREDSVKLHFTTREGRYKQMHLSEEFYGKNLQYTSSQGPASTSTPVKTSFVKIRNGKEEQECICLTIGRELFYFLHKAIQQVNLPLDFIDKRTYRGVAPTCHDINQFSACHDSVKIAVGFTAGQVQVIDVKTKQSLNIMNEDRSVEKSRVTCVKWFPNHENILLTSHRNGVMYTYDVSQTCSNVSLTFQSQPIKCCEEYEVYVPDVKTNTSSGSSTPNSEFTSTRNPLFKWIITKDGSAVNNVKFSPCGCYLAVVTQNGFLRVFHHEDFELVGSMRSYFGGLTACDWSPDGRFIATGGEDDLVTVWSFCEQCVISRGTGHSSWITDLSFDPYCCDIPSDYDVKTFYDLPSVNELTNQKQAASSASTTQEDPLLYNGDVTTSMRRLRTYSNVSKLSRMSLGLDKNIPSLSYRFGSVGQDSQLCLWEIDQNILACAREKRTSYTFTKLGEPPSVSADDNVSEVGNSSSTSVSSNASGAKSSKNDFLEVDPNLTPLRSLSNPQLPNVKKKKNGWSSLGKFATLGSTERRNSRSSKTDRKEHKRNASLPYFGFRGSNNQNNHKYGTHGKKMNPERIEELPVNNHPLGSELCPRIYQTTMLEPLVCKKISAGRLTGIDFKSDGIVTTCQEGFIQLWKRPVKPSDVIMTNNDANDVATTSSRSDTIV